MQILLALALASSVSPVSGGPTPYPRPQLLLTVQQGGQTIPPSGGTVTLEGIGSITFPAGAFSESQEVEFGTITDPAVLSSELFDFDQVALPGILGPDARS